MHIPDGFLDLSICAVMYGLTAIFWVFSFRKASKALSDKQVPLMATMTAMFFGADDELSSDWWYHSSPLGWTNFGDNLGAICRIDLNDDNPSDSSIALW